MSMNEAQSLLFGLTHNPADTVMVEFTSSDSGRIKSAVTGNAALNGAPKPDWGNCLVCNDKGTGKHYGIISCEGCKGFFKRSVRKSLSYSCRGNGFCPIDKAHRNRCQKCRLRKCLEMGMKREAVQCERKPLVRIVPDASSNLSISFPPSQHTPTERETTDREKDDSAYSSDSDHYCVVTNSSSPTNKYSSIETAADLLGPEHMEFKLTMPTLGVSSISMEYIYELATRLLFISVDWARSIPSFRGLDPGDQLSLLQTTWSDLFMLGVSQCSQCFPLSPLLTLAASQLKGQDPDRKPPCFNSDTTLFERVVSIKDLVFSLERLELGQVEYAYLKTIVIFNSDCQRLKNPRMVEKLQEKAHCSLKKYVERTSPQNPGRFAKILLRLPATKNLSPDSIEQIFFAPLIGTVRIENIMANIMNNSITF